MRPRSPCSTHANISKPKRARHDQSTIWNKSVGVSLQQRSNKCIALLFILIPYSRVQIASGRINSNKISNGRYLFISSDVRMALSFGSIISMRLGVYKPFVLYDGTSSKEKLSFYITRTQTLTRRFTDAPFFLSFPFSWIHVQNLKKKQTNEIFFLLIFFSSAFACHRQQSTIRENTFYFLCGKIGQLTL